LLTRNTNDTQSSTPGLRDVPALGWLFRDFQRSDEGLELIVVVNPAVLRDPEPKLRLWQFPETAELIGDLGKQ
jgi:type II secretory pathway component GspD/PulD (secretin)